MFAQCLFSRFSVRIRGVVSEVGAKSWEITIIGLAEVGCAYSAAVYGLRCQEIAKLLLTLNHVPYKAQPLPNLLLSHTKKDFTRFLRLSLDTWHNMFLTSNSLLLCLHDHLQWYSGVPIYLPRPAPLQGRTWYGDPTWSGMGETLLLGLRAKMD